MNNANPQYISVVGDSVFDNEPYVGNGRPFVSHLEEFLPGRSVDFRALDGAICTDVTANQLSGIDKGAAEALIVSVGGNDALQHIDLLQDPTGKTFLATALELGNIQRSFRRDYRDVLNKAQSKAPRVLALTIYRPRYHLDGWPEQTIMAIDPLLSVFNDVIQEECRLAGVDVLDNRHICTSDADFANPIEPSDLGGRKIAQEVVRWLETGCTVKHFE